MPAPAGSARAKAATAVASASRYNDQDKLLAARKRLAEAAIADCVQKQVAKAPPLDDAQRARLAALIWSGAQT